MDQSALERTRYWDCNWRKVAPGDELLAVDTVGWDNLRAGAIYTVREATQDYVYLNELEGGWCWWRFEDHDKALPITPIWEFPHSFEEYGGTAPTFSGLLLHWRFRFPNCYGASVVCDNPNRSGMGAHIGTLIQGYELMELCFSPSTEDVEDVEDTFMVDHPINNLTADDVAEILVGIMSRPHRIYG